LAGVLLNLIKDQRDTLREKLTRNAKDIGIFMETIGPHFNRFHVKFYILFQCRDMKRL